MRPDRRGATGQDGDAIKRHRSLPALLRADDEIVRVAAHLESTRVLDPADLQRLEAGRSDQPLDFFARAVVVGRVEEDRPRW